MPSREAHSALINAQRIRVAGDETLLQAALREGLDFPNSCRVGGCASCKCRLLEGQVEQRRDTSYLLSDAELDAGMILACQSRPLSDVRIAVDLPQAAAARPLRVSGTIIGQQRLTADITRLRVQLDSPLPYQAGQYAALTLSSLPGLRRNYSFAAPCSPDNSVEFFVRQLPGGAFSSRVHGQDLRGETLQLEGPLGDFTLRASDTAPLLMVAAGSGLAPVLAILKDALAQGRRRPATLLFGARSASDLYALDEIEALARQWPAEFRFVPVLSGADPDSTWQGARGHVTDLLAEHLSAGAQAYLCGPPAMVDAAQSRLLELGLPADQIHADRFISGYESPAPSGKPAPLPRQPAHLLDYLKFALFHGVGLSSAAALAAGGAWISACLLAVLLLYTVGDALCGDDLRTPEYRHPGLLTLQLWLALPLLMLIVFIAVWGVSNGDPLGFGAWASAWSGQDLLAARAASTWGHHVSAFVLTGLLIGLVGTITAHELTHRSWDPVSMLLGRWLLAFSFDTVFSIEHVYGHHRYVATLEDPATAPRGRNVYRHILSSTIKGNVSAWKIERRSLRRRGRPVFSLHNAVIRGHLMSAGLVLLAWGLGGAAAAGFFVLCALWGKALLEIVNYMEHYGIVRDPATPVQPHHSWNTNKRISSWSMFNLSRHSHHHAQGEVPFHALQPYPEAPTMISGYLSTIVVALIPPLWHHLMAPKLQHWDRHYATAAERELARQAEAKARLGPLASA